MPLCFCVPCDTFIFFICLSLFKTLGDLLLIQLPQCFLVFARKHYLHIKVCSFVISSWQVVIIVQSVSCNSVTSYLQMQCNRMRVCKCLCERPDSKYFRLCGPYVSVALLNSAIHQCESSQRCVYSKTLFMEAEIWIPCDFHMIK